MDILRRHEIFEMELLEKLKNGNFLRPLVFGGGTMLRLCYELNRYSSDLDFWFVRDTDEAAYFKKLKEALRKPYELTDAKMKFNTLLLEVRSKGYPKKLKIEIRRGVKECDFQEKIAFSKYSTIQVILKVLTLSQALKDKIDAALDRRDIRDFFDLEFLLRQGTVLDVSKERLEELSAIINGFRDTDYKVALGSVLESEIRQYYVNNGFDYLQRKINAAVK